MKITYFPNQPHCYAFGGFELQMLSAFEAAKSQGCNVNLLDPWSRFADFDIAHIWGFEITQQHNIIYSKKADKKVIVTTLLPDFSSKKVQMRFFISGLIDKVRLLKKLTGYIDSFVAVNEMEKEYIAKYFKFPANQVHVIPNIVSDAYFDPNGIEENLEIENYVLCVGNICERKNQLNLVLACNEIGYNILLIGSVLEGEESYANAVFTELRKNPASRWIKGAKENSSTLRTAYKNCKLFALLSHKESQPISILEAIAMNCRVILADKPYARQSFFKGALLVNPNSIPDIKKSLTLGAAMEPPIHFADIDHCRKENVGLLYKGVYSQL